jgi:hypothetical protein
MKMQSLKVGTSAKHARVAGGVTLLAVLAAAAWLLSGAMPVGTGFASKYICSSVFVSGRNGQAAFIEDVAPLNSLFRWVSVRVDRQAQAVAADAFGLFASRAVYREGCGCTLVKDVTEAELQNQPIASAPKSKIFHDDFAWSEVSPGGPHFEFNPEKLSRAIDNAFSEPDPKKPSRKTRAVLVVHKGKIIAERYAPGFHHCMPLLGWSMNKSVTNALVGRPGETGPA